MSKASFAAIPNSTWNSARRARADRRRLARRAQQRLHAAKQRLVSINSFAFGCPTAWPSFRAKSPPSSSNEERRAQTDCRGAEDHRPRCAGGRARTTREPDAGSFRPRARGDRPVACAGGRRARQLHCACCAAAPAPHGAAGSARGQRRADGRRVRRRAGRSGRGCLACARAAPGRAGAPDGAHRRGAIARPGVDDRRAAAALGAAGVRPRLRPVRAGAGELRRRGHRRRAHPRLCTAARPCDRRRQGQRRRPHLRHGDGSAAAVDRRRLPHHRPGSADRSGGQARHGHPTDHNRKDC